jgi:hypothetical protein
VKSYLIVVDMQKDFVDGALGSKETAAIVPAVVEKRRCAPAKSKSCRFYLFSRICGAAREQDIGIRNPEARRSGAQR